MAATDKIIVIFSLFLVLPGLAMAEDHIKPENCQIIDDFSKGISPGWTEKSFSGYTQYSIAQDEGQPYLRATSNDSASGLYYKIEYDPRDYPYIAWKWKVDNIIEKGDSTKKTGDDYAARLYVVFPAFFFWNTRAVNYIWANKLPKDKAYPNPYTSNNMMISVESGSADTGKWITERRNVYLDYKSFFGKEPPKVGAIAIMTDTDDTKEMASASYGTIAICRTDPRK